MSGWTITEQPTTPFEGTTRIGFVLDRSASMSLYESLTIEGFNAWLKGVKETTSDAELTLVLFAERSEIPIADTPVRLVRELDETRYKATGASTSLLDAIGRCINEMDRRVKAGQRVLVVILTDGEENSSVEFDKATISRMVEEREASGNWTFTYLSASLSAFDDARKIGIKTGNTARFADTARGRAASLRHLETSTRVYAAGAVGQSATFYSHDAGEQAETHIDGDDHGFAVATHPAKPMPGPSEATE